MSKLMYQRLDDILDILIKQSYPVAMTELTNAFSVSDRTIRTDITNLNDALKNVGASVSLLRGEGYVLNILNEATFTSWRNDSITSSMPTLTSLQERQTFLLYLLFKEAAPLSLEDFLERLFVSKNTFYSYLKSLRTLLAPYGLKIINRPNIGFELVGNELAKRQAISDLLIVKDLQEYLVGFTETELSLFDNINLELLKKIQLAYFEPLGLLDSDYYHKNILSHFALALSRITDGKRLTDFPVEVFTLKKEANVLMERFFTEIKDAFQVILSNEEKEYFIYHLSINAPRLVEMEQNSNPSNPAAKEIVSELLQAIKKASNFDWRTDKLLIQDLTSHIEGFINANLMDASRRNPLLETIKKSFPLAYDLCLMPLKNIGLEHGLTFSEDEVGYISLHIAGAIERSAYNKYRKQRVILICGTGRAMSRIIEAKINKHYQEKIEILHRLSFIEVQQHDLSEVDFVITTVPLEQLKIPHIYINMRQLDKDIEKVGAFIEKMALKTATVFDLFHETCFFHSPNVQTKEALLKMMTQVLESQGIVSHDFYESVCRRETISQTNINQTLAIPHPMSLTAQQSRVAVAILPNGIDWGNGENVHFVFLFAIKKEDYEETGDIYSILLDFIHQKESQKKILHSNKYATFIEEMKKMN